MNSARTIYTIGHSLKPIEEFCAHLGRNGVDVLFDVRSVPHSTRAPQYGQQALREALVHVSIAYVFAGDVLGGRPKNQDYYDQFGQVQYDRMAESDTFKQGLSKLYAATGDKTPALMCAEADPLDCHRFLLVTRHLKLARLRILHIVADGKLETQEQTEQRMLTKVGLAQSDLFSGVPAALERAYHLREREVAFLRTPAKP